MASVEVPIEQALSRWVRSDAAEFLKVAEEQRAAILALFPLEGWPTLPLERYAVGQPGGGDTFSLWLEFRSRNLGGIGGGAARKHLIYMQANGDWYYDKKRYASVEKAWEATREAFVRAFELTQQDDLQAVSEIDELQGAPALLGKALHVYFPDRVVPIYSTPQLRHFIEALGGGKPAGRGVALNRQLLALIRARREFDEWSLLEVMRFLYSWAEPRVEYRNLTLDEFEVLVRNQDAKLFNLVTTRIKRRSAACEKSSQDSRLRSPSSSRQRRRCSPS